jgi:hypothetical protein
MEKGDRLLLIKNLPVPINVWSGDVFDAIEE